VFWKKLINFQVDEYITFGSVDFEHLPPVVAVLQSLKNPNHEPTQGDLVVLWKVIQKAQRMRCGPPLPKEDRILILTIWKSLDAFHQKVSDHMEATKKQKEGEAQLVKADEADSKEAANEGDSKEAANEGDELFNPDDQIDFGKEDSLREAEAETATEGATETEAETETETETDSTGTSTDDDSSSNSEGCGDSYKDFKSGDVIAHIIETLLRSTIIDDTHDDEDEDENDEEEHHEEENDEEEDHEEEEDKHDDEGGVPIKEEEPEQHDDASTFDQRDERSEVEHADDTSTHMEEPRARRYFDEDTE
jgi:hypothetical protein